MVTNELTKEIKVPNPFKFLDAYQEDEADQFYGRKKESKELIEAFRKSSFVILFGPSGSGKSSLINCGLLQKIKVKTDKVFKIRRGNKGMTMAIGQAIADNFGKEWGDQFRQLIQELCTERAEMNAAQQKKKQLNQQIIQWEGKYQKGEITKKRLDNEAARLFIERAKQEGLITKNRKEAADKENAFLDLFQQFRATFNAIPYLIFDQFEELFTSGDKQEEEEFKTFLSLIFKHNLSIKILLSLRQEYFGKLSVFEAYVPQVLYRKCLVDDPDRKTIYNIIKNSFERFNINQRYDISDGPNSGLLIPELEKKQRINQLINKLEKRESQRHRFHLPFLQIYLYKLYEKDYQRSIAKNPQLQAEKYPHLEFELAEIEAFGDIQNILNEYIIDLNQKLITDKNIVLNQYNRSQNIVVRFLRHFKHEDTTKKRIRTESQVTTNGELVYFIKDEKVRHPIQEDIWREIDDEKYNPKISAIIEFLRKYRLLKYNDGFAELSHDVLGKIINNFPIERNLEEIYRALLHNSFEIYEKNGFQPTDLLDEKSIAQCEFDDEKFLPFILSDTDSAIKERKLNFWEKSKKAIAKKKNQALQKEKEKRKKELKEKERQLREKAVLIAERDREIEEKCSVLADNERLLEERGKQIQLLRKRSWAIGLLALLSLLALLVTVNLYFDLKTSKEDLGRANEEVENERQRSQAQSGVYQGTGEAYRVLRSDRTAAYQKVTNSLTIWERVKKLLGITTEVTLVGDFTNDLYIDLNKFPFYSQKIALAGPEKNPIIATKHLHLAPSSDSIALFFLADNGRLYQTITNYKKAGSRASENLQIANQVTAFEPYFETDSTISILLVKNDFLYRLKVGTDLLDTISGGGYLTLENTRFLAHYKDRFVANYKNDLIEFRIKGNKATGMKTVLKNKREIKSFHQLGPKNYSVVFEGDQLFVRNDGKGVRAIKRMIPHKHEDGISSIDWVGKGKRRKWLLGSDDRTASIWVNKKEKKRLIGHSDKILTTTYLDEGQGDFVLTASADGTIKIWDLRPMEQQATNLKEASKIEKLKCKSNQLYVGFHFTDPHNPGGYLVSYGDTLSEDTTHKTRHFQQIKQEKDNKGHITSFDFGEDDLLLLGGFTNKVITSTIDPKKIRIRGKKRTYPTIKDFDAKGQQLAMATQKGIYFFDDYLNDADSVRLKLKKEEFNSAVLHPTENLILAASENGRIYLWDVDTDEITILSNHLDRVRDAEFSTDGNWIISGSWDNTAILWKRATSGEYHQYNEPFIAHTNDIEDVEFYGNDLFLTASSDYTVRIFERGEGDDFKPIPSLIRHEHKITAATFSEDGQYIYSGDVKGNIKKWAFREFEADIKDRLPVE